MHSPLTFQFIFETCNVSTSRKMYNDVQNLGLFSIDLDVPQLIFYHIPLKRSEILKIVFLYASRSVFSWILQHRVSRSCRDIIINRIRRHYFLSVLYYFYSRFYSSQLICILFNPRLIQFLNHGCSLCYCFWCPVRHSFLNIKSINWTVIFR